MSILNNNISLSEKELKLCDIFQKETKTSLLSFVEPDVLSFFAENRAWANRSLYEFLIDQFTYNRSKEHITEFFKLARQQSAIFNHYVQLILIAGYRFSDALNLYVSSSPFINMKELAIRDSVEMHNLLLDVMYVGNTQIDKTKTQSRLEKFITNYCNDDNRLLNEPSLDVVKYYAICCMLGKQREARKLYTTFYRQVAIYDKQILEYALLLLSMGYDVLPLFEAINFSDHDEFSLEMSEKFQKSDFVFNICRQIVSRDYDELRFDRYVDLHNNRQKLKQLIAEIRQQRISTSH